MNEPNSSAADIAAIPQPKPPKEVKRHLVAFRVGDRLWEKINQAAKDERLTLAKWLRATLEYQFDE